MKKITKKLKKDKYKTIAYSLIPIVMGIVAYFFTVPSIIEDRIYQMGKVQLRSDPIIVRSPAPTKQPTPTPEALMGHKTYRSEKLNIMFEYPTKVKSGISTTSLTATEIGNIIYINDVNKFPDKINNYYIEVVGARNFRDTLEDTMETLFLEKPRYCEVHVYNTEEMRTAPEFGFHASEMARIQTRPASLERVDGDHEAKIALSREWRDNCGYEGGYFTYDTKHPSVLLFIHLIGHYGDYVGSSASNRLFSNIIENGENLSWEETIKFIE